MQAKEAITPNDSMESTLSTESTIGEYLGTDGIDLNPLGSPSRSPFSLLLPSDLKNNLITESGSDSEVKSSITCTPSPSPNNATPPNSETSEKSTASGNNWFMWGLFHFEPSLKNAGLFLMLAGGAGIVLGGALSLAGMAGASLALKTGAVVGGAGVLVSLYGFYNKKTQDAGDKYEPLSERFSPL